MTSLWLAWRDLGARKGRLALTAGIVAAGVGLVVATEALSRGRERAIASQLDGIAPQLRIVPAGVSASALERLDLGGRTLPPDTGERARALAGVVRSVDESLVTEERAAGAIVPVIGVSADRLALGSGNAAVGSLLAGRGRLVPPASVVVSGWSFRIVRTLPPSASAEDLALFVPLRELQAARGTPGAVSDLRVYLRAGAEAREAAARLRAVLSGATVIRVDRGEVADRDMQEALARHRALLYAITAAVVAACLILAAHLDASERLLELATLVAVGGTTGLVVRMLTLRSSLVGAVGGTAGSAAGLAVAWSWAGTPDSSSPALVSISIVGAVLLAAGAALPTALRCALRNPAADLQEAAP